MAIITKTMEEIMNETSEEDIKALWKNLENHTDVYDPENPPLTYEELARLRPYKIVERERKLVERYRKNDASMTVSEKREAENILNERREAKLKIKTLKEQTLREKVAASA